MANTEAPTKRAAKVNPLDLEKKDYKGKPSTLCAGCGHDSITSSVIDALWEVGAEPHNVAKLSGIGCSSKTTAYFLDQSHGFNSVHGRMAAIAAGVSVANRNLINVGISGDGDTASIGIGHFLHMVRRNVPIVYLIENNGCYGLTKGQFSATADRGSKQKHGAINQMEPIDCCALAIELGCGYVARSFSGDVKQLRSLLKGALSYDGTAVIDIVSPCVTFNNHEGSTKSYDYAKAHEKALHELGYIPHYEEIRVEYDEGTEQLVELHDGSQIVLKKLDQEYNPTSMEGALKLLHHDQEVDEFYTGLLFHDPDQQSMPDQLGLEDDALATLPNARLRPDPSVIAEVMETFK